MKSVGVIRIEVVESLGNPGVLFGEREDGKGSQDFLFTKVGNSFVAEIPYSDQNIEVAKSFWKQRGCKVSCKFPELVNPFPATDFDLWFEKDKAEMDKDRKRLKAIEKESKALLDKLPELQALMTEEYQKYVAARELAETKRVPHPPEPESLKKAGKDLEDATKRLEELALTARTIERGLL